MKRSILCLCFFLIPTFLGAQEIDKALFKAYDTALVIYNRSSGTVINADPKRSSQRLSPCSTFKIYNTLFGLELGLIPGADVPWYKWDGVHRDIEGWNRDLTLREAFQVSAVPAYQILARQIGPGRMKKYIDEIDYGTRDISAGINVFWLDPEKGISIKISADEQATLLNKLLDGKLPFSRKNVEILKDVMRVTKTERGTLYGKTGSGRNSEGALGWFVGFLESKGTTYVFACNIISGQNPSGKAARTIVEDVFKSQGLL